jgi:hypothetical protein
MKPINYVGWLLAALLLFQNAATGMAASGPNPLEGQLLRQSDGTFYLYHNGLKFLVPVADVGDAVIEAIPTATADQWNDMFRTSQDNTTNAPGGLQEIAGQHYPAPAGQPEPFPGYS